MTHVLLLSLLIPEASACGGLFCNGATVPEVEQTGGQVLFATDAKGDTSMHVLVDYAGPADAFSS